MATGVAELSTTFSSLVPNRGIASWKSLNGQAVTMQAPVCKRSPAVVAVNATQRQWAEEEESTKRSSLVSTAMALAGVAMVVTSVASSAEAAIQKVEGTERGEQDAVTTGIRERSTLSTGKGNTMMESGKGNAQASGGLMLGAPKLEEPAGAYRSPQSSTYGVDDVGSKRSTPAGILQGTSEGKSGSGGEAKIGGSALADE